MAYQPYLIANYSTGVDKRLQPWLIPDEAQEELFDGYVYRGTQSKRDGYNYFADGLKGGSTYRESRIVHKLTAVPAAQAANGILTTFTLAGLTQIARGSLTVNGSNPVVVGTDNGSGSITGTGITSGTVNYTTGAISVTFTVPPVNLSTVTFTYSYMPGNPVMMIANFLTSSNIRELIVADTRYVNRYNQALNILEDISTTTYTGNKFNFFSWVNYEDADSVPRLLFSNNVDVIQQYNGTVVSDYAYTMQTSAAIPVAVTTLSTLLMFDMKDRLLLLRTTENGQIYGKRIRISGTGANSDNFDTSSTGAGFIDIPDATWIQGAAFNRDDLLIFTEQSTWVLKYTGNDTTPFVLNKIDESRGSDAPYAAITYLNRTSAASRRGLIITDGYRVERQDMLIPDFSFNEVDGDNFRLCFAGSVDADRDHYLIYPPQSKENSLRILTTNYDEDNYSTYRLPLSCMGTYISASDVDWDDLLEFTTWEAFSEAYGNWNSFAFNSGAPFSIGGGHYGEIWQLSINESEDNPVRIYNITVIDAETIEVTTDWNNYRHNVDNGTLFDYQYFDPTLGADLIFLSGIGGMQEINNQQFPISLVVSHNVFRLNVSSAVIPATSFTPYTSGGGAVRVIPFSSLFKKFNPFIDQDRKVRCGWIYMYVDSSGTNLQRNIPISDITQSFPAIVTTNIDHGLHTGDEVSLFLVGGMTQLNGTSAIITVLTDQTFSLDGIDSTAFGAYTSGGYVGVSVSAKMFIDVIIDDAEADDDILNLSQAPYQGNMTTMTFEQGSKKWYKVYINQTAKLIQFRFRNQQAGAKVNIQATMPGFEPTGKDDLMPTLITNFNWGSAIVNDNPELTRQLSTAYTNTALVVNTKVSKYVTKDNDPPANSQLNKNFEIGDIYVRTDTNSAWIMTSRTTAEAVTWSPIT